MDRAGPFFLTIFFPRARVVEDVSFHRVEKERPLQSCASFDRHPRETVPSPPCRRFIRSVIPEPLRRSCARRATGNFLFQVGASTFPPSRPSPEGLSLCRRPTRRSRSSGPLLDSLPDSGGGVIFNDSVSPRPIRSSFPLLRVIRAFCRANAPSYPSVHLADVPASPGKEGFPTAASGRRWPALCSPGSRFPLLVDAAL